MNNNTLTNMTSTLGINLGDIQQVSDAIRGAVENKSLDSVGNISAMIQPDKILAMIQDQTKLISSVMGSMGSSSILGQSNMQSTLNSALSTVMNTMMCSIGNMSESLSTINNLSKQVESMKSAIQTGDIAELQKLTVK